MPDDDFEQTPTRDERARSDRWNRGGRSSEADRGTNRNQSDGKATPRGGSRHDAPQGRGRDAGRETRPDENRSSSRGFDSRRIGEAVGARPRSRDERDSRDQRGVDHERERGEHRDFDRRDSDRRDFGDRRFDGRRGDGSERPSSRGGGSRSGERSGGGRDLRGGEGRGGYGSQSRGDRGSSRSGRFERSGDRGGRGGYDRRDDRQGGRGQGQFRDGDRSYARDDRGRGREFDGGRGRDDAQGFGRGGQDADRGGFNGRGDGGAGWSDEQSGIRGPRSWDAKAVGDERPRRKPEPVLPEGITGYELDKAVRQQLRTLSKENAEGVAQHLVAAAELLYEDPQKALDHAQHAVSRAGRVPAAREALGLVLYRTGEFAEALREFRTARRLSGSDHLLPYMVDCERGLGRFERALELANSPEAQRLSEADNIELAIVVSGVRRDMEQARAAVVGLRIPALHKATTQPWAARLYYAYADALMDLDERDEAREWFVKADAADHEGETDAADRIDQIDGFELTDLAPEDEQEVDPRLAQIDLSAFGGRAPRAADAAAASEPVVETETPSEAAENTGERSVPSAAFDDGASRG